VTLINRHLGSPG